MTAGLIAKSDQNFTLDIKKICPEPNENMTKVYPVVGAKNGQKISKTSGKTLQFYFTGGFSVIFQGRMHKEKSTVQVDLEKLSPPIFLVGGGRGEF